MINLFSSFFGMFHLNLIVKVVSFIYEITFIYKYICIKKKQLNVNFSAKKAI